MEAVILKTSNVLQFNRDAGFYYKLSQAAETNDNMADAVFYLKKAALMANDDAYTIELAKKLSLVSQFDQSNLIYLKLLVDGKKEDKCCFGLSQNLYYQSNIEQSLYYLNLYMDKYSDFFSGEEEEEYMDIIEESDLFDGYSLVYPLEKQDMSDIVNESRSLMKSGLFEPAVTLLKKIPSGNYDYIFALNNIALCYFFMNDYVLTKTYSDKVLEIDKDNVFALCNLAAMYNYLEDEENASLYLNRILALKVDELSDLFKIATTLCELKEHALALKYLKTIMVEKPYDINIMFLTAIAFYNNKQPEKAIDLFLKLNKFNEKDYTVRYYLKLIRQTMREKDTEKGFFQPLEYICQVPYGEMLEKIKQIKGLTIYDIKNAVQDEDFFELCDWIYTLNDYSVQKVLTEKLASFKSIRAETFLREKLIDPAITLGLKRIIVEKFMEKAVSPPYDICVDYKLKRLNPCTEKAERGKKLYYNAYAFAYSALMLMLPFEAEKELFKAYLKVLKATETDTCKILKDKKTIAAVIAYMARNEKMLTAKGSFLGLFGADKKDFDKYLKIVNKETE